MNPALLATWASGALVGLGVALLFVMVLSPAKVSLKDALGLDRSIATSAVLEQESSQTLAKASTPGVVTRAARGLEERMVSWRITTPDADLALIEWSRGRFLLVRIAVTAFAVLIGPAFVGLVTLGGGSIGYVVPQAFSLLLGLGAWYTLGVVVKDRAAARRLEMREALVSYLTLVALYRAAGQGMIDSLQEAAGASDAWTFRRIAARLSASVRGPVDLTPEIGLRMLGAELGIGELTDVADIATSASMEGAGIFTTLLARADALRNQMQSDAEANAASKSAQMGIPKALLAFTGIAFMLYPLFNSIAL